MNVTTEQLKSGDYYATCGQAFGFGRTQAEAIGHMILCQQHTLDIIVNDNEQPALSHYEEVIAQLHDDR